MSRARRALVCSPVLPKFDRESGSRRIFHIVEFLRHAGWAVTFAAPNAVRGDRYVQGLQQIGVAVHRLEAPEIDGALCRSEFDLAIIAFWHLAAALLPKIRALSPGTRIVVDSIDVHFLREARATLFPRRNGIASHLLDSEYGTAIVRELNAYAAADAVLTVSEKEAALVNDFLGDDSAAFNVPDCEALDSSSVPLDERKGILFLGNFQHPPNVDAVKHLCGDILPRLDVSLTAKHPIYIVGNGLKDKVARLCHGLPNVHVVGWVPSVEPYFARARVSVVPLRFGAGTKRKLLQSLMVGTPCVTTSVGAEGLGLVDGEHVLIADHPQRFADAVARLCRESDVWSQLARQGEALIRRTHAPEVARTRLLDVVQMALDREPKPLPKGYAQAPFGRADSPEQRYRDVVQRLRAGLRNVPRHGGPMLVVSKGDNALVTLDGHEAWHFPRNPSGQYAGSYPADSAAAIAHLEALREQGARSLLFPQTALWWLDHYVELRNHLARDYREILRRDDFGVLFSLERACFTESGALDGVTLLRASAIESSSHSESGESASGLSEEPGLRVRDDVDRSVPRPSL